LCYCVLCLQAHYGIDNVCNICLCVFKMKKVTSSSVLTCTILSVNHLGKWCWCQRDISVLADPMASMVQSGSYGSYSVMIVILPFYYSCMTNMYYDVCVLYSFPKMRKPFLVILFMRLPLCVERLDLKNSSRTCKIFNTCWCCLSIVENSTANLCTIHVCMYSICMFWAWFIQYYIITLHSWNTNVLSFRRNFYLAYHCFASFCLVHSFLQFSVHYGRHFLTRMH